MKFLRLLISGSFALLVLTSGSAAPAPASRPNIVLILCDDMGWSDIGCYGGEVDTPNLNRLAREGLRFTQFYNNAKCTTTRASIVTGLYPRRGKGGLLREDMATVGEVLGDAGYHTALSGKWHLGSGATTHPYKRGFDEFYGLLDGCCNFFDPSRPDPAYKGGRVRKFGKNDGLITEFPEDFYTTDAFTDNAIDWVKRFSKSDKPFFLHLCYTAPHYPLHAKPDDIAKYRGRYKALGGWLPMREQRWDRLQQMGLTSAAWQLSGTDSKAYDWESADQDHEDLRMSVYAAMIDRMDQNIGRLMRTLKETGEAENTLVIFLSDNGGCAEEPGGRGAEIVPGPKEYYAALGPAWGWAQNAPFKRHKSWVHEGGIGTPCIAWWPGRVKADTITRQPAHIIDFLPTFLELAGGDFPKRRGGRDVLPVDGNSMLPILMGETREPHRQLAWEWSGNRALREGDMKVVWDSRIKQWELYDLARDRCETKDLAGARPELTERLSAAWFDWAKRNELSLKKK